MEIDVRGRPGARARSGVAAPSPGRATTSSSSRPAPARSARRCPASTRPGCTACRPSTTARRLLDTLDAHRGPPRGRGRRGLHRRGDGRGADRTAATRSPSLNRGEQPMSTLDPDMGRLVHEAMDGLGITTVDRRRGHRRSSPTRTAGSARWPREDAEYPADVVVLGIGVEPRDGARPRGGAAARATHGGLLTDLSMRVRGPREHLGGRRLRGGPRPGLGPRSGTSRSARTPTSTARSSARTWAAATPPSPASSARRSARSATWRSPARACARRTRWQAGLRFVTATIESTSRAGYYPGAALMTVKMLAERRTGRLLGVQIVGRRGRGASAWTSRRWP